MINRTYLVLPVIFTIIIQAAKIQYAYGLTVLSANSFGGYPYTTEYVKPPQDTTSYTLLPGGIPRGERAIWREDSNIYHHRLDFGRVLESVIELNDAGLPIRFEFDGIRPNGIPWEEKFELTGNKAIWKTPSDGDTTEVTQSAYYASLEYQLAMQLPLLARFLLDHEEQTIPLLPYGKARLEKLGERDLQANGKKRTVTHYAIYGLDLSPEYLWLDDEGRFFADDISILAGWEDFFPELKKASEEALIDHGRRLFGDLIPPEQIQPLVIRGARLFDPKSQMVKEGITIVVKKNRVDTVGRDEEIDVPEDSEIIDAAGLTVLPGLWDMHTHIHPGFIEELDIPLFVAAGITTVRDLGNNTDMLLSVQERSEAGEAIAPRILPALIMYGPGKRPIGVSVGTPEEARNEIDRYAELGYVQVKLYNPVPQKLVPDIIERAKYHGMRVSGHIPNEMTGHEVIERGFNEIQHLFYARIGAAGIRGLGSGNNVGARMAAIRTNTEQWKQFVQLLQSQDMVVDPTLAVVEETVGGHPATWLGKVLDRFPKRAGKMTAHHVGPHAPPPMLRDHWDQIVAHGPELLYSLYKSGIPLVAGTDAMIGGFALHRELELYVEAGIPAPEVLTMATFGAARVMGRENDLGSVEPGKIADFILVEGNPTTNISDVRRTVKVIKDGKIYDPSSIYNALGIEPCCEK